MTLSFAERDLGLLNISLEDGFINLVFLFLTPRYRAFWGDNSATQSHVNTNEKGKTVLK